RFAAAQRGHLFISGLLIWLRKFAARLLRVLLRLVLYFGNGIMDRRIRAYDYTAITAPVNFIYARFPDSTPCHGSFLTKRFLSLSYQQVINMDFQGLLQYNVPFRCPGYGADTL